MRAADFIVEYNQQKTLENYRKKLLDALMADERSPFGQELRKIYNANVLNLNSPRVQEGFDRRMRQALEQLEGADPTPNKRYVQWLVRGYINGFFRYFEDAIDDGNRFLRYYLYLANIGRLPEQIRDINQVKTRRDFSNSYDMIERLHNAAQRELMWGDNRSEKEKAITDKGNSEEMLNNSEVRVLRVLDEAASCYYGQGTRWCTASTYTKNWFDDYNRDYNLYIFIPKKAEYIGEKYQVALPRIINSGNEIIMMDEKDTPVKPLVFQDRWKSFDAKTFLATLITKHSKQRTRKKSEDQ